MANWRGYVDIIKRLHENWEPHDSQVVIGRSLLSENVKEVFAQCGRNFGKTELVCYLLHRWAAQNPGSENYYFSPFMKQSREILWESQRLQNFGGMKGRFKANNSEMRLTDESSGSFIKLDGSDNVEAYRGVKPKGLIVYDEFKDFKPEFHVAMEPNLIEASLFVIGTPPQNELSQYYQLADEFMASGYKRYFEFSSDKNPHIAPDWLARKKEELYRKGEGDVWEREYMARRVFGGHNSVFPMLTKDFLVPPKLIDLEIARQKKRMNWHVVADPGNHTFGVLFMAFDCYTGKVYLMDEIYETDQAKTTVASIGQRIIDKKMELNPRTDWIQTADEAATWFRMEMYDRFNESFGPTQKSMNDKEVGVGLMKDIMLKNWLVISEKCDKFYWEARNYIRDKNGKLPKINDHLLDCFRYGLGAEAYSLNVLDFAPSRDNDDEGRRFYRIQDDLSAAGYDAYDGDRDIVILDD